MKTINSEKGFCKMYWSLCDDLDLTVKDIMLLSYLIDIYPKLWEKKENPEDNKTYYRVSTQFVRERIPALSEEDIPKSFKHLAELGYIVDWRPTKCPRGLRFIRLEDSLVNRSEECLDNRSEERLEERSEKYGTNKTIILKEEDTKRKEDDGGIAIPPISIPESKIPDTKRIAEQFDRILGVKNLFPLDLVYSFASPLFKREFTVDDMCLVIEWAYNDWSDRYRSSISPKSCFREDRFNDYLSRAKIWEKNKPKKSAEELEKIEKERIRRISNEMILHPQEEKPDEIGNLFDDLCMVRGWSTSASNRKYTIDLIKNSQQYKDGSIYSIVDEVKNNTSIDMFAFQNKLIS